MKVVICDETLREATKQKNLVMSFKEKLEVAKRLDELNVDIIGVGPVLDEKTDSVLFRTIGLFLKNSVICCSALATKESIDLAYNAIKDANKKALSIIFPVSTMQMEYMYHKKQDKMLALIEELVKYGVSLGVEVETVFDDATRAEEDFLFSAISTALKSGASHISVDDTAGIAFPMEFNKFVKNIKKNVEIKSFGISCNNNLGLANACVFTSIDEVNYVKTSIFGDELPKLDNICKIIASLGEKHNLSMNVDNTKVSEIVRIINKEHVSSNVSIKQNKTVDDVKILDKNVTQVELNSIIKKLGYELSIEDENAVYETFMRLANKKEYVKLRELDVVVANAAMQVPATYTVDSYVINSGNKIRSTASIIIKKNDALLYGLSDGDGPIDAAFKAIEKTLGYSFELDEFKIQAATEGTEAIGEALIKLRYNGKLYSGSGISTDINGASIRAYIAAVNKIVYEDKN